MAQTYRNLEVLVSDDASTDDTWARLSQINDPRLVLVRQPEALGIAGNYDFCLRRASGEYFLCLNDDDLLLPPAVERLITALLHPGGGLASAAVGLAWCPCRIINAENRELWATRAGPAEESAVSFIESLWTGRRGSRLSGILYRTEDALAVGGFQHRYGDICDMGLFGPVALLRGNVVCVNELLVQYRNHQGSTTSQSAMRNWQNWARLVHGDMVEFARSRGDAEAVKKLQASRSHFITGVTLTIMVQTVGAPGWIRRAVKQALRSPEVLLRPYVARRLFMDGLKLLRLRQG